MKYRKLGKHGIKVSEISIGGWLTYGSSVDEDHTRTIIHKAIDLGINFIDIADIYAKGKSEKFIGNAIKGMTRSDLVISSKLFWPMSDNPNDRGLSRKHIMESVEKSLERIGTDYLDMYFCHRFDPDVEMEEIVRAMDDLVHQGKVLYWGTSVWEAEQIQTAVDTARSIISYLPTVEQPRYNMLDRHIESDILPTCARNGLGLVVWSPLAQGLLTGKYKDGKPEGSRGAKTAWLDEALTEKNLRKAAALEEVARELGITIGQLALAWILRKPEISSAITGATRPEHVEANVAASDVILEDDVLAKIDTILSNKASGPA